MQLSRESRILAAICILDMVSTLWFVLAGIAIETNPILNFCFEHGALWFILVKSLLLIGPLFLLEWLRPRRPRFVLNVLRAGIVFYLLFYGIGVWQVNQREDTAQASSAPTRTVSP